MFVLNVTNKTNPIFALYKQINIKKLHSIYRRFSKYELLSFQTKKVLVLWLTNTLEFTAIQKLKEIFCIP